MLALIPIHHVGFWCFLYSRSFSHHFSCLLFYVLLSWKFILSFLFIHFDIVYKQFSLNCSFSLWTAPLTVFHLRFVFFSKRISLLNKKMFWYIHMLFTFGIFSIFFQVFLFFCIILCLQMLQMNGKNCKCLFFKFYTEKKCYFFQFNWTHITLKSFDNMHLLGLFFFSRLHCYLGEIVGFWFHWTCKWCIKNDIIYVWMLLMGLKHVIRGKRRLYTFFDLTCIRITPLI